MAPLDRVYLDHNATTPLASFLPVQIAEWLKLWGNPSSIYGEGRKSRTLLRESRKKVASALGVHPLEVVFTSGGSEGNSTVIKGVYFGLRSPRHLSASNGRKKYLHASVEHPSVRKSFEFLAAQGAQVETIPVSRDGEIDLARYEELLDESTALVSVMLANNETGHVFPIAKMAQMAHKVGALFHTDAVQGLGKIPVQPAELGVDYATFSAHKFYALKGAGCIYIKRGSIFENLLHGGGQERGRRGGTENLMAVASLAAMMDFLPEVSSRAPQMAELRDYMERSILERIPKVAITGAQGLRLPNTSNMVIDGIDGESLLMNLDLKGFSVSTGAACSSGNPEPSPVLLAMGLSREEAQSSMRVGLGWSTTKEQVDAFVDTLASTVAHLRSVLSEMQKEKEGREWS